MRNEIAISILELGMSIVIVVQFLALFLLMFNNKILKNGLQKKKTLPPTRQKKTVQKVEPLPRRNPAINREYEL